MTVADLVNLFLTLKRQQLDSGDLTSRSWSDDHAACEVLVAALGRNRPVVEIAPGDIATCLYYTGIDPFTKKEVHVAKGINDRKLQRALMQFFKAENWFDVREALLQVGRHDSLASGCDSLIPSSHRKR